MTAMPTTPLKDAQLHAVVPAQSVVQAHEVISLTQNDFAAFLGALDASAPANPALQRALQRHAEQVLL